MIKNVSGLENQGYIVYTDNFYTSSALFSELTRQGFGAVGTISTNRRGCPDGLERQKKKMLKPSCERGTGVWIRDQSIVYNLWKDTKMVCTASTVHSGNSDHQVKRRVKKPSGGCEEVNVPIPNSTYDYNRYMRGVDFSDQLLQYYQICRQTQIIGRLYFIIPWISLLLMHISCTGRDSLEMRGQGMITKNSLWS